MSEDLFIKATQYYEDEKYTEAFQLFLSLAENGDDSAMLWVAMMHGDGIGTEYNLQESISWDMKAIETGNFTALFNLGISYRNIGDKESAKNWFERALASGYCNEAALELAKLGLANNFEPEQVKQYLYKAISEPTAVCEEDYDEALALLKELGFLNPSEPT